MVKAIDGSKWQDAPRAIFSRLNLETEFTKLGLKIKLGARPSSTGWLSAHAMGREDKTASASINVGDGPSAGRYRDFGGNGDRLRLRVIGNTNPTLLDTSLELTGTRLTLDYLLNQNGSADITIEATDQGGETAQTTFRVNVAPVNDADLGGELGQIGSLFDG